MGRRYVQSPVLANMLRLIEEMAEGEPGEVPDGSEMLAAEPGPPSTTSMAADRAPRQAPTLGDLGHRT